MDNLWSSEIDRVLEEDGISDGEDSCDIEAEDLPGENNIFDYSSDSDEYVPEANNDHAVSSDSDDDLPLANRLPINNPWIRVYPPEAEIDVGPQFKVRNPGPRECPPRNSSPVTYALLFFTANFWRVITDETNAFAQKLIDNKRDSGEMKRFSRLKKWVAVTIDEMKRFIALLINMGLNGDSRPRRSFCPGCNCGVHRECYYQLKHYWRLMKGGRKKRARSSSSSSD